MIFIDIYQGVKFPDVFQNPRFSRIFNNSRNNPPGQILQGSTIDIITAHAPGQTYVRVRAVSLLHRHQNSGCLISILRDKILSLQDRLWRNSRENIVGRAQQYKSARVTRCQCTDWLSAMQNGRGAAEGFSTLLDSNRTHISLQSVTLLNHKTISLYWSPYQYSLIQIWGWQLVQGDHSLPLPIMICRRFYSEIKYTQHCREFLSDLTSDDWMMYRLAKIATYCESPPICIPIIAIESIEKKNLFSSSFKKSSVINLDSARAVF